MIVHGLRSLSRFIQRRIVLLLSVIVYIVTFSLTYKYLCAPVYEFYGLSYASVAASHLFFSWIWCVIPAIWMPTDLRRPSQLLFLILYFLIYIPLMLLAHHVSLPEIPPREALVLLVFVFVGFSIIQSVYVVPLIKLKSVPISARLFWIIFWAFLFLLFAYVLIKLIPVFRLANLAEIYDVRSASSERVLSSGTRFGFYAAMWLGGFFLPFCFAVGAFAKRYSLVIVSLAGYVLLFGLQGTKTTLFAPIFLTAIYIWSTRIEKNPISGFALALSVLLSLPALVTPVLPGFISKWYVAVVHFRTFALPSLMFFQHYDFFQTHEVTHMSHISGINLILDNPYAELGIPKTIGLYYYGRLAGANAVFWGADGLAGFGLYGIIFMSMVCASVFWLIDCLSRNLDARFIMVAIGFVATCFANVSLFTTLVSGGLVIFMGCFYILPDKGFLKFVRMH